MCRCVAQGAGHIVQFGLVGGRPLRSPIPRKQRQIGLRPQSLPPCPKPDSETQWRHPGSVKPRLLPAGPASTQFSCLLLPGSAAVCGIYRWWVEQGNFQEIHVIGAGLCHRVFATLLVPTHCPHACMDAKSLHHSDPLSCLPVACERDLRPQTTCPQNWRAAPQAWQRLCRRRLPTTSCRCLASDSAGAGVHSFSGMSATVPSAVKKTPQQSATILLSRSCSICWSVNRPLSNSTAPSRHSPTLVIA